MTLLGSENLKLSTHACLAQLDQHQTCKPVMISVVSSSPTGGNFIFFKMLVLYKNYRNVRFVLFTKTSTISEELHEMKQICRICSKSTNGYYCNIEVTFCLPGVSKEKFLGFSLIIVQITLVLMAHKLRFSLYVTRTFQASFPPTRHFVWCFSLFCLLGYKTSFRNMKRKYKLHVYFPVCVGFKVVWKVPKINQQIPGNSFY